MNHFCGPIDLLLYACDVFLVFAMHLPSLFIFFGMYVCYKLVIVVKHHISSILKYIILLSYFENITFEENLKLSYLIEPSHIMILVSQPCLSVGLLYFEIWCIFGSLSLLKIAVGNWIFIVKFLLNNLYLCPCQIENLSWKFL